jgi:hypothetical protein
VATSNQVNGAPFHHGLQQGPPPPEASLEDFLKGTKNGITNFATNAPDWKRSYAVTLLNSKHFVRSPNRPPTERERQIGQEIVSTLSAVISNDLTTNGISTTERHARARDYYTLGLTYEELLRNSTAAAQAYGNALSLAPEFDQARDRLRMLTTIGSLSTPQSPILRPQIDTNHFPVFISTVSSTNLLKTGGQK